VRPLTKSLYKLGLACPRKLYYQVRPQEYVNASAQDDFLAALAEGGFQVGELAKLYYPGGVDVDTLDKAEAIARTQRELAKPRAIIFEAAIALPNLFIRVDILVKEGNTLKLIEVKAKSYSREKSFWQKRDANALSSEWLPYLQDVAFQTFVARRAFPDYAVTPYLMLADTDARATRDGLHQLFLITKTPEGRARVTCKASPGEELGERLLTTLDVSREVALLQSSPEFEARIRSFQGILAAPTPPRAIITKACRECEFRCDERPEDSGFHHCLREHGLSDEELKQPLVFDLANFRDIDDAIARDGLLLAELDEELVQSKPGTDQYSQSDRQWLQIRHARGEIDGAQLLRPFLKNEIEALTWPLHFIDFETTTVAIPFFAGQSPYSLLAFQFSHHILHADGRVEHAGEYLHPGRDFPNFAFARALKSSLERHSGSIFRYSHHENTVVNKIVEQLEESSEHDKAELIPFLRSISHTKEHTGERDMLDLCDWVKAYYWHPRMGKSNSIKAVLPAVLLDAPALLREKFPDWVRPDENGLPRDPYELLPPLFEDLPPANQTELMVKDTLADGAAAMTAYARLQFEEMPLAQDQAIRSALLRYCHLDTLAMVMIFWRFYCEPLPPRSLERGYR